MTLCTIFRMLLTLIASEAEVFCSCHMQNLEPGELHIFELWYEGWMLQRKATPPWWHSHSKVGHVGSNSCWQWATKWPDWKDSLSTSNASTTRKVHNRHRPLTSNDTQWHILIAYSYYICSNDDWSIYLKCWRSFLVAENTLFHFRFALQCQNTHSDIKN